MKEIRVSYTAHSRQSGDFCKVEFAFSLDEGEIRKNVTKAMQAEAKKRAKEGLEARVTKSAAAAGVEES